MSPMQTRRAARRRAIRLQRILFCSLLVLVVSMIVFLFTQCSKPFDESRQPLDPVQRETIATDEALQADAIPDTPLPESWKWRTMPEAALSEGTLVLVNADHAFDPALPQTVSIYENKTQSYLVKDIYLSVTAEAMAALNRWMDDFAAQTGITDVNIVAGWRSYDDQLSIYDNAVVAKGQAHADAYIALPGHSEHHTGLAVDLDTYDVAAGTSGGFDGIGAYAWAVERAWEYGFVQRYPPAKSTITGINYESWHFRYVGLPHAYVMTTENLCLEEYIDYLRSFPFDGDHLTVTCQGSAYELYYCPGRNIVVPTSGDYTISGNNIDGFIITING